MMDEVMFLPFPVAINKKYSVAAFNIRTQQPVLATDTGGLWSLKAIDRAAALGTGGYKFSDSEVAAIEKVVKSYRKPARSDR